MSKLSPCDHHPSISPLPSLYLHFHPILSSFIFCNFCSVAPRYISLSSPVLFCENHLGLALEKGKICLDMTNGTIFCYMCQCWVSLESLEELQKVQKFFERFRPGVSGMRNLYNTCYFNAVVQALCHCDAFVQFFLQQDAMQYQRGIAKSFSQILLAMWDGDSDLKVLVPQRLLDEITDVIPMFRPNDQQDSHELYVYLIDKLNDDLLQNIDGGGTYSLIELLFGILSENNVHCLKCGHHSKREEKSFNISLSIPNVETIKEIHLRKSSLGYLVTERTNESWYTSIMSKIGFSSQEHYLEDLLHGFCLTENFYQEIFCDTCKEYSDAETYHRLKVLPETLILHIKRFNHNSYFGSKVNDHVVFPLKELNMMDFLSEGNHDQNFVYDLEAVIVHRGTFFGGHYICYAYNQYTMNWYCFDDSRVSEASEEEVMNSQAYMLFYSKQKKKDNANPKIEQDLNTAKIPKSWMHKWRSFSDPGPIYSPTILCEHGNVKQSFEGKSDKIFEYVPSQLLHYLKNKYQTKDDLNYSVCEICDYSSRRKQERKDVTALQKLEFEEGEPYYIIDANWVRDWYDFTITQIRDNPPGEISNTNLLDQNGDPRSNLQKIEHYRGINKELWEYFVAIYGGGPEIVRQTLDIYTTKPNL